MNEEIKEILDCFKRHIEQNESMCCLSMNDVPILLDYITNLQEENERLKEENKRIFSKVNDDELLISNAMNYAEAQDYKLRIDKAIKIIQNDTTLNPPRQRDRLTNLLNGGDEE